MFKSKEVEIPLRRSELISPTGIGALTTNSDGINLMPGALDMWFDNADIMENEFEIYEERLSKIFNVDSFRLPPDYRAPFNKYQQAEKNLNIRIPMVRFPNWYYCSSCKTMSKEVSSRKDSILTCSHCKNNYARLIQVPLIVACEKGHLDDFPWNEWVHESLGPRCKGPLKLISTGGATLSSMKVKCTSCSGERSLRGLTTKDSEHLYDHLSKEGYYKCTGRKPWFGDRIQNEECSCIPQPILKNASNAYFSEVLNAIYLPPNRDAKIQKILDLLALPNIMENIELLKKTAPISLIGTVLKTNFTSLSDIDNALLEDGIAKIINSEDKTENNENAVLLNLKIEEYDLLASNEKIESDFLVVQPEYDKDGNTLLHQKYGISKINLIPKLRETRVLYGFSRLNPPLPLSTNRKEIIENGKSKLFIKPQKFKWLPAYKVQGEGIYIEFDDNLLSEWESSIRNSSRVSKLNERLNNARQEGIGIKDDVSPRYVMLHTLAHLFIQEIVLSCGYSSSSLKERIYVGPKENENMNGFLIYTSSGDSEGTMGGLVRLGKISSIESILEKAISKANWCSSDPVCNEIGMDFGQGRDFLNGAACHNCAYVSEISCEELNKYLDRGFVNIYDATDDFKSFFNYVETR